jgi:O-antigen ligase
VKTKRAQPPSAPASKAERSTTGYPPWLPRFLLGGLLGLTVAKFGNPALLDHLTTPPTNLFEWLYFTWPLRWAYFLVVVVTLACLPALRWPPAVPRWLAMLPAVWLVWQGVASIGTVDAHLTRITLPYLASAAVCYYLGLAALRDGWRSRAFWGPYLAGFLFMLLVGFQQQFGGLEATREQILSQPGWEKLPPEFLKRINKLRVFATLLYPNALAGVLLLLLPAMTVATWRMLRFLTRPTRLLLSGAVAAGGLACLYWSRSKAGWLVLLAMLGVLFWRLPVGRPRWKAIFIGILLVAGLGAFFLRFSGYFAQGAPSVSARLDYWRAAVQTVADHPLAGSGPGTFQREYERRKPPEAEMARLAHNDYLQQASDTGLPGALLYATLVWGTLAWLARRCWREPFRFAVWLGLLGWALQSCVEFGLYLAPIGWAAFLLLGALSADPPPPAENPNSGEPKARRKTES